MDFVINNGLIVDGTGKKPYIASLGIKDNKIIAIDKNLPKGNENIDITGLAVAPGFIDLHAHSDCAVFLDERSQSKVFQGVTTELNGNCGISIVPNREESITELKRHVGIAGCDKIGWHLHSLKDYATELNRRKITINYAPQVGHSALRIFVMGCDNRKPDGREMKLLKKVLADELEAGAWGMSAGLIYAPGSFSQTDELIELAKVIAKYNKIFSVHIRNENIGVFDAIKEMIEVGRKSGAHIEISHLKLAGPKQWGKAEKLLKIIKLAQDEGINISCDQYPYTAGSTSLNVLIPKWAKEGGTEKMLERLNGPKKDQLLKEIKLEMDRRGGAERIVIANIFEEFSSWESKTIIQISQEMDLSVEETVIEIINKTKNNVKAIYHLMSEDDVFTIMRQKNIAIGSDGYALPFERTSGKPHPRSFGCFPRFLKIVRENNFLSLEDAIYKITALPAKLMGLNNRGVIAKNNIADLVVFNSGKIADTATFENPFSKPLGIQHVFVAGKPVILNRAQTSERPGKVLLKK